MVDTGWAGQLAVSSLQFRTHTLGSRGAWENRTLLPEGVDVPICSPKKDPASGQQVKMPQGSANLLGLIYLFGFHTFRQIDFNESSQKQSNCKTSLAQRNGFQKVQPLPRVSEGQAARFCQSAQDRAAQGRLVWYSHGLRASSLKGAVALLQQGPMYWYSSGREPAAGNMDDHRNRIPRHLQMNIDLVFVHDVNMILQFAEGYPQWFTLTNVMMILGFNFNIYMFDLTILIAGSAMTCNRSSSHKKNQVQPLLIGS